MPVALWGAAAGGCRAVVAAQLPESLGAPDAFSAPSRRPMTRRRHPCPRP
eukprot:CAMPEP_0181381488 /NCGR_PEP_ID=MMETSP1106-20121128/20154_1 /TAXON_ID=81844 /ORGANISM="Mantoniella antarctica, Strain SL-175" /LENGTH=49 /DNA_ID= /DNA_START= /DNA_END= /DNA_ORIENTATION=